jgi:hypothetical protein
MWDVGRSASTDVLSGTSSLVGAPDEVFGTHNSDPEDALSDPECKCLCRTVRAHRQIGVPRSPLGRERNASRTHPAQLRVSLQWASPTPGPVSRDPSFGGHNPARSRVDLRRPSPTSTPPFRPGTSTRPIGRADSRVRIRSVRDESSFRTLRVNVAPKIAVGIQ